MFIDTAKLNFAGLLRPVEGVSFCDTEDTGDFHPSCFCASVKDCNSWPGMMPKFENNSKDKKNFTFD